jgi:hypothetical protein
MKNLLLPLQRELSIVTEQNLGYQLRVVSEKCCRGFLTTDTKVRAQDLLLYSDGCSLAQEYSHSEPKFLGNTNNVSENRSCTIGGHFNKLRGLIPRANYTDRATATCRRS